jgi:ketosteroid isomerase-like protein
MKGVPLLRKIIALSALTLACVCVIGISEGCTAAKNDEAEIRQLLDRWAQAFSARDLDGIMSICEPGQALVAFDLVAPLRYTGFEAYKKDYQELLEQFQGPIGVEYRDLSILAGDTIAFSRGLERLSGTLKDGQKFDAWVRFTECYRKTNGHWRAIHTTTFPCRLTSTPVKRSWTSNRDTPALSCLAGSVARLHPQPEI